MKLTLEDARKIQDFLENNYVFGWTGNVDNIIKDLTEIELVGQIEPQVMEIIDKAIKNEETAIKMNRLTNNMRGTVNYCLVRLNAIKTELSNLSL